MARSEHIQVNGTRYPGWDSNPHSPKEKGGLSASRLPFRHPGVATSVRELPSDVPPPIGRGHRMAVGAEQPQVLESVVVPVAIDVIELEGNRLAAPLVA